MLERFEKQMEQIYKLIEEMQKSNSDHHNQLRIVGNFVEEIRRDFDEIKKEN